MEFGDETVYRGTFRDRVGNKDERVDAAVGSPGNKESSNRFRSADRICLRTRPPVESNSMRT